MADPMKIRANVVGDSTEVKVLMNHEMETGQRKDAQGKVIPAWFIQSVNATYNGKTVLSAQWGPAVSKNPFLAFKFKGARRRQGPDHLDRQPRRQADRRSNHRVTRRRRAPRLARRYETPARRFARLPPKGAARWGGPAALLEEA
jgi:sulfur-oxidizing protein SoxZ